MADLAQTNLQLYNQLTDLGWDDGALVLVRDAYVLASELFSGQLRPSGKTFVSHLVGTASALAAIRERPALVGAGLLHAAYTLGEFGDGSRGFTTRKHRVLTAAVGTDVERLVAAYTRLDWRPAAVAELQARATRLSAEERDVVLIRLANEVDDHADVGMRYWTSDSDFHGPLESLATLAERIGVPAMAGELRRVGTLEDSVEVPAVLVQSTQRSYSRAPRSHRRRLRVAARDVLQRPKIARMRGALRRWASQLPLARRLHRRVVRPDTGRAPHPGSP